MLTVAAGSGALAQAPAAAPKAKSQPKAQPKSATPAPPAAEQPQAQGQAEQPQLIFSPWTKFCLKGQEANAKQVCFTGKDGRVESGMPVVAAVLIEPEGEPRKILRVTLPLGMSIQPGTRVIVDQGQPMTGPYVICFNNGCMADYEASLELIGKLKGDAALKHISLLGYLSHVQAELKMKAQEAGCDVVMPRSAFSMNLPQILNSLPASTPQRT